MSDCPVNRTVHGNPCDGPGTYYCDSEVWGSECRRYFEQRRDRQTETQLVPCWHCGDDVPIDTADVILAASGVAWVCQECAT